jgi:ribosome-binding protein aMBF1 (putative translation factor)
MLRRLRENRGWEVSKLAAELKAQATAIGQPVPDRQSPPCQHELRHFTAFNH